MASSSSCMGSMNNPEPQRLCKCEEPEHAILKTSHSEVNPERHYFYCCRRGRRGDCGYRDWLDPELSSYYKDCFQKVKLERDLAVEQLALCGKGEITISLVLKKCEFDEDLKKLAENMQTMEWRIKGLYLAFVVVGVLVVSWHLG